MPHRIEVVQRIDASQEHVWAALTEPEHLTNWQADEASGHLDSLGLRLAWPALGVETVLNVLEAEPGVRLVLASGRSRVTFELDSNVLHLTHDGLSNEDERDGVLSSWQIALKVLDHYVSHHFCKPRQVHWSITPAPTTPAAAHVFYTDAVALNAWLTRETGGIGEPGSSCSMLLRWGERLSGIVLSKARDRDVAITWREQDDSVLVFRTFPSPFVQAERILALSWSHWDCPRNDHSTRGHFQGALSALRQLLAGKGLA